MIIYYLAFCSRDTAFHENLTDKMDDLQPKIERFIEEDIIPNFELKSFVADVYWKLDGSFYIFDFRERLNEIRLRRIARIDITDMPNLNIQ